MNAKYNQSHRSSPAAPAEATFQVRCGQPEKVQVFRAGPPRPLIRRHDSRCATRSGAFLLQRLDHLSQTAPRDCQELAEGAELELHQFRSIVKKEWEAHPLAAAVTSRHGRGDRERRVNQAVKAMERPGPVLPR